jgi:hypothetical protein
MSPIGQSNHGRSGDLICDRRVRVEPGLKKRRVRKLKASDLPIDLNHDPSRMSPFWGRRFAKTALCVSAKINSWD